MRSGCASFSWTILFLWETRAKYESESFVVHTHRVDKSGLRPPQLKQFSDSQKLPKTSERLKYHATGKGTTTQSLISFGLQVCWFAFIFPLSLIQPGTACLAWSGSYKSHFRCSEISHPPACMRLQYQVPLRKTSNRRLKLLSGCDCLSLWGKFGLQHEHKVGPGGLRLWIDLLRDLTQHLDLIFM